MGENFSFPMTQTTTKWSLRPMSQAKFQMLHIRTIGEQSEQAKRIPPIFK